MGWSRQRRGLQGLKGRAKCGEGGESARQPNGTRGRERNGREVGEAAGCLPHLLFSVKDHSGMFN